ncbi:MAG: ATP-binding protein [Gammaproteobacteria bacterium]|nr:ATP-binding protein [Gammaproteobacteria bacterium]
MKGKMQNRIKNTLALLTITLLSTFFAYTAPQYLSFLNFIQYWEDDVRIATLLPSEAQHPEIIVITVTEETLSLFPYRSPIDRHFVSNLLINLEAKGVRAILLDFLFDQPTENEKDLQLHNTLLALKIPVVVSYGDNSSGINLNPQQQDYLNEFLPIELRGLANISKDQLGTVRWIYPGHHKKDGLYINSIVNALAVKLGHFDKVLRTSLNRIAWHGTPDAETLAFRSYPAHMVKLLPAAWFKNKIVLIGSELNITDRHRTPFSIAPEFNKETTQTGTPGIFIHAHALAHVLDQRKYPSMGSTAQILIIIFAALAGIVFAHLKTGFYLNIILGGLSLIIFWLLGITYFSYSGLLIPLTLPTLGLTISFILTALFIGRTEHVEKQVALEETQVKSRFLANMSHEIRSPMTAIIGMTEITLESNIDTQQRKYLTTVLSSARALLNLINDILDLSKLESGKMKMESITFDLRQMLEDTITTLSTQAQSKGLELNLQIEKSLPACYIGDPLRLRQVILNLTNNAIKFTSRGSVQITVSADKNPDFLLFAVKDTGMGIAPDRQSAVFDSFTQADGSTSRMHGGTGLGTTISKQIVEMMQGRIWLQSKEGQGSTFFFSVSIAQASGVSSCKIEYGVSDKLVLENQRSLKVLVVDDIEENLQLCTIRLQQKRHQVFLARDGLEAVAKWQAEHFDVILMDAQMPRMDGFEATKTIRSKEIEQQVKQTVPIVAMTANAMKGDREKCLAAGMDDYISKPIDFNQLFATMDKVVPDKAGIAIADLSEEDISDANQPVLQNDDPFYNLHGVDTEAGLLVWGNKEVYKKSLISFARSHADDAHKITSAWRQSDHACAKSLSHALKGVAGNLSMPRLTEIAIIIDQELRDSPDAISRHLEDMSIELEAIVTAIRTLTGQQIHTVPKTKDAAKDNAEHRIQLSDTKLITLLHALDDHLDAGDVSAAEEIIERINNSFADQYSANVLSEIIAHIDAFDFSQAQERLKGLLESLEINSNELTSR